MKVRGGFVSNSSSSSFVLSFDGLSDGRIKAIKAWIKNYRGRAWDGYFSVGEKFILGKVDYGDEENLISALEELGVLETDYEFFAE